MTEEARLFRDEIKEKSIIARSAHCKNSSAPTTRRRTKKEIRDLSGPIQSYNLTKPMDYAVFVKMPEDLQEKYLREIIKKYHVGPYTIAKVMNCSGTTIAKYIKRFSLRIPTHSKRTDSQKFLESFGGVSPVKKVPSKPAMIMTENQAVFDGKYNSHSIMQYINSNVNPDECVKITITILRNI